MGVRMRVTGTVEVEDWELDSTSDTGLTREAFSELGSFEVRELDDLTTELVDE